MKLCVECGKELDGQKKKYCSDSCSYWYRLKITGQNNYNRTTYGVRYGRHIRKLQNAIKRGK